MFYSGNAVNFRRHHWDNPYHRRITIDDRCMKFYHCTSNRLVDKWTMQCALYTNNSVSYWTRDGKLLTIVRKINKFILFHFISFDQTKLLTRSSEPSAQSESPSQTHLCVIQVPSPHLKLSSLHFSFGQFNSSLLSPQSAPKERQIERARERENKHKHELLIRDLN